MDLFGGPLFSLPQVIPGRGSIYKGYGMGVCLLYEAYWGRKDIKEVARGYIM